MTRSKEPEFKPVDEECIYGRNVVLAFLEEAARDRESRTGSPLKDGQDYAVKDGLSNNNGEIEKIFLAQGSTPDRRIDRIKTLAKERKIPVMVCDRQQLDRLVGPEARHQGIVARLSQTKTFTLSEFLQSIVVEDNKPEKMLVAMVDGIEDPQNLGSIIRVADAAGAKALITGVRRTAGTTGAVAKASAGALARLPIVKVQNLVSAINELKKFGFWVAGLDAEAKEGYFDHDLRVPLLIVIGSEDKGLSRLVAENCDFLLSIPMSSRSESLNAAVAAGIVFYEYVRQTLSNKK